MVQAVVALGGNLGNVAETFRAAKDRIEQHEGIQHVTCAGLFRSSAMGADAGEPFFNTAWTIETTLSPRELLDLLQCVENESGRTRDIHWGPRTLDLDLIFYGDQRISSPRLTVPHPHYWYRRFVLAPVASLVPDQIDPESQLTVRELSDRVLRNPFRLVLGGTSDAVPSLERVAGEFPDIHVSHVASPGNVSASLVSLAVWAGHVECDQLPPLWVSVPPENAEQSLRDLLTAACTEVVTVAD